MVQLTDEWVLLLINDDIIHRSWRQAGRKSRLPDTIATATIKCLHHHLHPHHHHHYHQAKHDCDGGLQPACSHLCSCSNVMLGTMDRQRRILGSTCHGSHGPRGWNDHQPSLGYIRIPQQAWILP